MNSDISDEEFACHRCFENDQLVKWIKETSERVGTCSLCNSRQAKLISLVELCPLFNTAMSMYHQSNDEDGEPLSQLLQEDWMTFSKRLMENADKQELLNSIIESCMTPYQLSQKDLNESGRDHRGEFVRNPWSHSDLIEIWETDRREILADFDSLKRRKLKDSLREVLDYAISDLGQTFPVQTTFYRARVYKDRGRKNRFTLNELASL